jgi:hypothetical protein
MSPEEPMIDKQDEMGEYIPGVCNIGKEEVKRRRSGAILAAILSGIVIAALLLTHAGKLWRFLAFVPLASFGISVQQWSSKFCVGFGMKGIFNFKNAGEFTSVEQQEMIKADRAKAIKMIVIGLIAGLVSTIIFYLVP